jgi:hypothetical protein
MVCDLRSQGSPQRQAAKAPEADPHEIEAEREPEREAQADPSPDGPNG